jgi:hypothetical protein
MSINSIMRSHLSAISMNGLRFCLLVSLTMIQALRADDDSTKANNMLNTLKQRSAADRWQRVKRQYPVDAPAPRRNIPGPLPQDQQRALTDEELPPIPTEGFAIPRLTALPSDDSTDWIRPARPVLLEEGTDSSLGSTTPTRAADISVAIAPPAVDQATDPSSTTNSDASNENAAGRSPRTPIERMIGSINPSYDRDRDSDIRQFAVEKAKEFNSKGYEERSYPEITLAWEPTNFYYYPLYFSDPALERYGHSYPRVIQPLASIARFGAQFVLLPYQMAITPPCKPEYPLGYYRPGECAPKLHYQIPLNAHAAVVEAAVVTGLFFVIP